MTTSDLGGSEELLKYSYGNTYRTNPVSTLSLTDSFVVTIHDAIVKASLIVMYLLDYHKIICALIHWISCQVFINLNLCYSNICIISSGHSH